MVSNETLTKLIKLVIAVMAMQLFIVGYVFYTGYQGRVGIVNNQRAGCNRGKLDRIDNAAFQRAHKLYIDRVVLAASVKADVKAAARDAVETYNQTAANLTKRSLIDCSKAFPDARLIP